MKSYKMLLSLPLKRLSKQYLHVQLNMLLKMAKSEGGRILISRKGTGSNSTHYQIVFGFKSQDDAAIFWELLDAIQGSSLRAGRWK